MAKKLLVADDSLTIQKVIRLALSGATSGAGEGYEIQTVSDGNDAVQQISLFRPDIVLIDVSLPSKSAFEVKRATNIHRDLDHVRFVLMSSAFEKVDELQVGEVVFHGRLTKPFDPAHLRDVLSQVLSHAPGKTSPPPLPTIEEDTFPNMPPMPPDQDGDSDIRNLTQSTIQMTGLDDMLPPTPPSETPSPPPMPGGVDLPPEPPSQFPDDFQWTVQENSLKPPPMIDSGNSNFPSAPPSDPNMDRSGFILRPPKSELHLTPAPLMDSPSLGDSPFSPPQGSYSPAPPASTSPNFDELQKKLEEMVRQEVQKALRELTQQTLPVVTERLIKEEIHKLLSETP